MEYFYKNFYIFTWRENIISNLNQLKEFTKLV